MLWQLIEKCWANGYPAQIASLNPQLQVMAQALQPILKQYGGGLICGRANLLLFIVEGNGFSPHYIAAVRYTKSGHYQEREILNCGAGSLVWPSLQEYLETFSNS